MKTNFSPSLLLLFLLSLAMLNVSCSSRNTQTAPPPPIKEITSFKKPKTILIFLDGTSNKWNSRTNVRRLFENLASHEDPSLVCYYLEGVGSNFIGSLSGAALGRGMKPRIKKGYQFLSQHYETGDKIYLFGFSRGAHQARALTGIISHCGLLSPDSTSSSNLEKVWDFCRKENDISPTSDEWNEVMENQNPPFSQRLEREANVSMRFAPIEFIGLWDTVPGSAFKKFGPYGESLKDNKIGIRYKSSAYPPIKHMAHALSLDERRSRFKPLLVDPKINKKHTRLEEYWFAGAHSDVGGGYSDTNALSGVSLNWMIEQMQLIDQRWTILPRFYQDPLAPQHESINDYPGNKFSKAKAREFPQGKTPRIHPSVELRKNAKTVWYRSSGRKKTFYEASYTPVAQPQKSH